MDQSFANESFQSALGLPGTFLEASLRYAKIPMSGSIDNGCNPSGTKVLSSLQNVERNFE